MTWKSQLSNTEPMTWEATDKDGISDVCNEMRSLTSRVPWGLVGSMVWLLPSSSCGELPRDDPFLFSTTVTATCRCPPFAVCSLNQMSFRFPSRNAWRSTSHQPCHWTQFPTTGQCIGCQQEIYQFDLLTCTEWNICNAHFLQNSWTLLSPSPW